MVYVDPLPPKGHSVHFVPDEDAIAVSHEVAKHLGKEFSSDEQALENFKVVNWAETIEQTVERMAIAMFTATYAVSTDRWKEASQDSWRKKAKAALKSLGVDVP